MEYINWKGLNMNGLTNEELMLINGGAIKIASGLLVGIAGAATFIIGVINGILRPLSCSKSK